MVFNISFITKFTRSRLQGDKENSHTGNLKVETPPFLAKV